MKKLPGSRVLLFVLVGLVALVALNSIWGGGKERTTLSLATFQLELAKENVRSAEITESDEGGTITGELDNGTDHNDAGELRIDMGVGERGDRAEPTRRAVM